MEVKSSLGQYCLMILGMVHFVFGTIGVRYILEILGNQYQAGCIMCGISFSMIGLIMMVVGTTLFLSKEWEIWEEGNKRK